MLRVTSAPAWQQTHPGSLIGLLEVSGADNTQPAPALDAYKRLVETRLRQDYAGFTRPDFIALPLLAAYRAYYKKFDMTYHVQLQLESIVLKEKRLPDVSPLVDANFCAEMETLLLAAGHDADLLQPPASIDIVQPGDTFIQMGGARKNLRPGDICMKDASGIVCSILHGQDNISPISRTTRHALYVVYAPPGVTHAQVRAHLDAVLANLRRFATDLTVEQLRLLP
jgi:DNA/RNA-binding domain of Phe-tRNA-synthetase-like protein